MRAVIAPHITDLTRYTGNGAVHQRSDEATVSLIGELEELLQVKEIGYAGYRVLLDHQKQQAQHEHHLDPTIPFKLERDYVLQVFLYGLKPQTDDFVVEVKTVDGGYRKMDGDLYAFQEGSFISRMSGVNDWSLIVDTKTPLDLIRQSKNGVKEEETRILLEPGHHQIEVKPDFAERYAICLSPTDDPYGSIEVKHSFLGEVGASSGRFLWSRNKLWLPPTRTLPAYRSLIVDCVTEPISPRIIPEMQDVDELEVIATKANLEQVRSAMREFPQVRSRITIADKGFGENVDIALVDPTVDVPVNWSGRVSFLLFNDQATPEFRSRLEDTLFRLRQGPGLPEIAVESLWTCAEGNHQEEGRNAAYGIAWSTSSSLEQKGRVSFIRAMATEAEDVKARIRRFAAQPFNAKAFLRPKGISLD